MDVNITPTEALSESAATAEAADGSWKARPNPALAPAKLAEAATLFGDALKGNRRKMLDLQEALTTSDFPVTLGGVFEREALARYEDITPVWNQFAARAVVKDFRPKKLVDLFGGRRVLDPVAEGTEYPARSKSEAEYSLQVAKRGGRFQITFEDIVNDDLDQLRTLPEDLAAGARDTEDWVATTLLVKSTGVNTDFFKTANGNAPTTVALSADTLETALTEISQRKDKENRPIVNRALLLVVPPALEATALRIVNTQEIRRTVDGITTIESNALSGRVRVVVNPWLPLVNTSAKANTTWFLLPDPNAARKALTLGFLRGHEAPDLRYKADSGNAIGGGSLAPEQGSFDDDTIQYRVRHILGGATLEPIATYASTGS